MIALSIVWEILAEGGDAHGAEEDNHVIALYVESLNVRADAAIECSDLVGQLHLVHKHRNLCLVDIGLRNEIFLLLVLLHDLNKLRELAFGMKNLTFPVDDIFLKINSDRLRDAEIFHCVGDSDTQLSAKTEEVINSYLACENYRREAKDVDTLLSEGLGVESLNLNERLEVESDAIALRHLEIWRLGVGRRWLGNENLLYFQCGRFFSILLNWCDPGVRTDAPQRQRFPTHSG